MQSIRKSIKKLNKSRIWFKLKTQRKTNLCAVVGKLHI